MFEVGDDEAGIECFFALDADGGAVAGSIERGVEVDAHVNAVFTIRDEAFLKRSVFVDILPSVSPLLLGSVVIDSRKGRT